MPASALPEWSVKAKESQNSSVYIPSFPTVNVKLSGDFSDVIFFCFFLAGRTELSVNWVAGSWFSLFVQERQFIPAIRYFWLCIFEFQPDLHRVVWWTLHVTPPCEAWKHRDTICVANRNLKIIRQCNFCAKSIIRENITVLLIRKKTGASMCASIFYIRVL